MSPGLRCRRAALTLLAGLAAGCLAGCATPPPEPRPIAEPATETIYVAAFGWHTEIGLGADEIDGPLAVLRRHFPGARYFMFGWGQRDFYMARDPGLVEALRALTPGPAVMLVRGLDRSPLEAFGTSDIYVVKVSPAGLERLSQYLWRYLDEGGKGELRRAGDGPYPGSAFYVAAGTYDLGHTCNTWTAEALDAAGLPVHGAGVVFAGEVVEQLRGLAWAARPQSAPN